MFQIFHFNIKPWTDDRTLHHTSAYKHQLTSLRAAKTAEKNLCCLLKINITSVIDTNENEHASRRYAVVFFVLVAKFMICHYYTNTNASFIIYHKFLW